MTTLSLREAAEQTGVSKSTIFRAIQSGRMSASRTDDGSGNFAIDPAELFRVYPAKSSETVAKRDAERAEGRSAQAASGSDTTELRIRNAQLEAEIKALRTVLETEKERAEREIRRVEEIKAERDKWCAQAERLSLGAPIAPQTASSEPGRRSWWLRWQRAG